MGTCVYDLHAYEHTEYDCRGDYSYMENNLCPTLLQSWYDLTVLLCTDSELYSQILLWAPRVLPWSSQTVRFISE